MSNKASRAKRLRARPVALRIYELVMVRDLLAIVLCTVGDRVTIAESTWGGTVREVWRPACRVLPGRPVEIPERLDIA